MRRSALRRKCEVRLVISRAELLSCYFFCLLCSSTSHKTCPVIAPPALPALQPDVSPEECRWRQMQVRHEGQGTNASGRGSMYLWQRKVVFMYLQEGEGQKGHLVRSLHKPNSCLTVCMPITNVYVPIVDQRPTKQDFAPRFVMCKSK